MLNASIRAVRDVRFMADHECMEHAVRSIATMGEPCEHDDEGLWLRPFSLRMRVAKRGDSSRFCSQEFRRRTTKLRRPGQLRWSVVSEVGKARPMPVVVPPFVICPSTPNPTEAGQGGTHTQTGREKHCPATNTTKLNSACALHFPWPCYGVVMGV